VGGQPAIPSVSAIVPAYNAASFLHEALESVLAQTLPVAECLVVNDGSSDGTSAVAQEYGDSVRLIEQENRGVSAARNRGAAEARGELLAFLDADDRWLPERIERGVLALEARPDTEAVVCATRVVDRDLRPVGVIRQHPDLSSRDMLLCRASVVSASSNLLIRSSVFATLGGFDERLSTSADWALTFRLVERGRLIALPDSLVEYRRHDDNMSRNVERFERDMLTAFGTVLDDPEANQSLRRLRRRAYANLHRMIAGSYFVDGRFSAFARHAALSLREHPSTAPYFLGMPLRRLRRRRTVELDPFTSLPARGRPPA